MKQRIKSLFQAIVLVSVALISVFYFTEYRVTGLSSSIPFDSSIADTQAKTSQPTATPKNIIIFIADGMGFGHLSLAQLMSSENNGVWGRFQVKSWHQPRSTYGPLTDSGASATAMATGTPTFFDVIGEDPDGVRQESVFERGVSEGYITGIVTDSYIWDATPAAFVAHTPSRDNAREILEQIADSELELIFGELEDVGEDEVPEEAETLELLASRFTLLDHSLNAKDHEGPVAVVFDEDEIQDLDSHPNLPQMTSVALDRLVSKNKPFLLLVESEETDSGSHENDSDRVTRGLESIMETLSMLMDFAEKDGETLVVFTSDHETGGLVVRAERDYPHMQISWGTFEHTASVVPLYAYGPGADHFQHIDRNWHIGQRLKDLVVSEMHRFGRDYTTAWNSRNPARMASFYATDGSLTINNGVPSVGTEAIAATARSFMEAFPDMVLTMDSLVDEGDTFRYHWTFEGTYSGPGGNGNHVLFSGFERWSLNEDGKVKSSVGTFDAADYNRQLAGL